MAKFATLFLVALILCSTLTYAARHEPGSLVNSQHQVAAVGGEHAEVGEESCDGVGEDECLMRRTLAAHIDYIYTQKTKP